MSIQLSMITTVFKSQEISECPFLENQSTKEVDKDSRTLPYAPRSAFRTKIIEHYQLHKLMKDIYYPIVNECLPDGKILSCPICHTNEYVISRGSQTNGAHKFQCTNKEKHSNSEKQEIGRASRRERV